MISFLKNILMTLASSQRVKSLMWSNIISITSEFNHWFRLRKENTHNRPWLESSVWQNISSTVLFFKSAQLLQFPKVILYTVQSCHRPKYINYAAIKVISWWRRVLISILQNFINFSSCMMDIGTVIFTFILVKNLLRKVVIWITDILECLVIGCNIILATWKKPRNAIFVHKFPLSYFSWQ